MTFDEMRKLGPNWDSYGAQPIDAQCIQKAIDLIYILPGKWEPIPCADGSVQLEQHVGGFDLELMISRAGKETSVASTCDCDGPQKVGPDWHAPYCSTVAGGKELREQLERDSLNR